MMAYGLYANGSPEGAACVTDEKSNVADKRRKWCDRHTKKVVSVTNEKSGVIDK